MYTGILARIIGGPTHSEILEGKYERIAKHEPIQDITFHLDIEKDCVVYTEMIYRIDKQYRQFESQEELSDFLLHLPAPQRNSINDSDTSKVWRILGRTQIICHEADREREIFFGQYNPANQSGVALILFDTCFIKKIEKMALKCGLEVSKIDERTFRRLCQIW